VLVDPSAYDRSCTTASDCAFIGSGEICDEQCSCAEALINSSGLARYQQAISSIDPATCFCGDPGEPACLGGQCVVESGVTVDAGPPDAGFCVDVDLSTYDTSCKADGDCINVTAGLICDGDCLCGGSAAINVDGQARYEATIAPVQQAACECPVSGAPRCIARQCTLCGPGTNPFHECPDGG
jgi:hypothetical protein